MSSSDDQPTPRLTQRWQAFASSAREMSTSIRTHELRRGAITPRIGSVGSSIDTRRSDQLRRLRVLVDDYAGCFARWTTESVPLSQKQREQSEFMRITELVKEVLANEEREQEEERRR